MPHRPTGERLLAATLVLAAACSPAAESPLAPSAPDRPSFVVVPGGNNTPPSVAITSPTEGQLFAFTSPAGAVVNLSAAITDVDESDTHTCTIEWAGSPADGTVVEQDGTGTCTGSWLFPAAGVYTIRVTATDSFGESGEDQVFIVVYDPSGGFVTGGGWIMAAPGSYLPNPGLQGKATFGFVSKYKKGAATPDGNTEFQFHAAGMNFHSTAHEWLVVAGSKAQFKGIGVVNGLPGYSFMLTAIDGDAGAPDRLRMKIWNAGGLVFDNQLGAGDGDDPVTALAGGNIVVHKK